MNRSGTYKSNLSGEMMYTSFLPSTLPPNPPLLLDETIVELLVKANVSIAKQEAISSRLPSVPLFVSMYVRKEALLSSQIEGTQATLDDILDPHIEKNTNQNIFEVVNYIKATDFATERLKTLPRQFETIHPFLDGNGRIGRLMINLFLKENRVLTFPTLYISYYLKRNRIEYYDRLNEVRVKGTFEQWVNFFL